MELKAIFQQMPSAVAVFDNHGRLTSVNDIGRQMFGGPTVMHAPRADRMHHYDLRFLDGTSMAPDDLPSVRALRGEFVSDLEYTMRSLQFDGRVSLRATSAPLVDADGVSSGAVLVVTDITAQRRLTEELRRSEEHLRMVCDAITLGVEVRGDEGSVIYGNAASERLLGRHPDRDQQFAISDEQGRPLSEPEWPSSVALRTDASQFNNILRVPDDRGGVRWLRGDAVLIASPDGDFRECVSSYVDITNETEVIDALRDLTIRLFDVQEAERKSIAMELHDELGQVLTGVQLLLTDTGPLFIENVGRARQLVGRLIKQVQSLALNLRPMMLDDLGLKPTLRWYVNEFESRVGLPVRLDIEYDVALTAERRFALAGYRIVQEALTNVARHAGATQAGVRVWQDGGAIRIEIRDDGVGLPPDKIAAGSLGLLGMRERAAAVGGLVHIKRNRGGGTCVSARLPLQGEEGA